MFVTFIPPNLSRARVTQADIDLFVSKDPKIMTLDTAAIQNALKSVTRGGTEAIMVTNAVVGDGEVYYIGVKSEDQQAAEFGLYVKSSDEPFSRMGPDGAQELLVTSFDIPDGTSDSPGPPLASPSRRSPCPSVASSSPTASRMKHGRPDRHPLS